MGMMIIRHRVRDYGQWRPLFDGHAEMQKAAGLSNPRVYHSADSNKSEIVVVFDTEDTKKAKDFVASADLKEAMAKAGVLDAPTILPRAARAVLTEPAPTSPVTPTPSIACPASFRRSSLVPRASTPQARAVPSACRVFR
jgi:hypothetical protein